MSERSLIIVKVGTGVLTKDDGSLNESVIAALANNLAEIKQTGAPLILISSGAVGAGVPLLNLQEYPQDIGTRQAAAAVGQAHLMQAYQRGFSPHGISVAQTLLSSYDLKKNSHCENVETVLTRLLQEPSIIPIVNENDVVSLRELTKTDNDMLAANLSVMLGAKTLILLSTIDGLLDENSQIVREVESIETVRSLVKDESGKFSIGGMLSKLDAVERARENGAHVIIGNGNKPERLSGYLDKSSEGTYFG